MPLNRLHEAHIGRVAVSITLSGPHLDPASLNAELGLLGEGDARDWTLRSTPGVQTKDVNDHLRFLLDRLLPHKARLVEVTEGGEVYADVLWESSYLYAGTGPVVASDCIEGLAALRAELGFDIYDLPSPDAA